MKWKVIAQSAIGTSHIQSGKGCEDSVSYEIASIADDNILICCVSDGAGSALYAGEASSWVTQRLVALLIEKVKCDIKLRDSDIFEIAERIYDELYSKAEGKQVEINEYSCTALGCVLYADKSIFIQIGDGAIITDDGGANYVTVWWPQNGEYSNTTNFLIDDIHLKSLEVKIIQQRTEEIAITTDGLQMLILSNETRAVHQPFFTNLFKTLRLANKAEDLITLNKRLDEYLRSDKINDRTDDDKTLLLATRLGNE